MSNFSPESSFKKNNSKTPKSRGSVGINMPIPPKSKLSKLMDKGVQKAIISSRYSKDRKAKRTIATIMGRRLNQ